MGCGGSGRVETPSPNIPVSPSVAKTSVKKEPAPEPVSESFHKQYLILGKLGKGAFAQVHLARKLATGEELAVKVTDLRIRGSGSHHSEEVDLKTRRAVMKEVSVLRMLGKQDYCVGFIENFTEGVLAYVIMERCQMTLLQALERLPEMSERSLVRIFKEMLDGLRSIHSISIVHRDVKPDNFLCTGEESTVKLCDFGLAEVMKSQKDELHGVYGTAPFMAPEMLGSQGYGPKADVWSLGVIVYVLLLGQFPYQPAECTAKAMKAAVASGYPEPTFKPRASLASSSNATTSPKALDFLKLTLRRQSESRPTAQEALTHGWLDAESHEQQQGSLHPMLFSAKRCGAFDTRKVQDEDKQAGSIDSLLITQQIKHHGNAAHGARSKKQEQGSDTGSDRAGSHGKPDSTLAQSGSTNTGGSTCPSSQSKRSKSNSAPRDA